MIPTSLFGWTRSQKSYRKKQEICQDTDNQLYLSMASVWEMQIKIQLGKLDLKVPLADMVKVQQQDNGLQVLDITLEHVYQLQRLPFHHNDPFDRMIIAQSFLENMPVISVDGIFAQYAVSVLW